MDDREKKTGVKTGVKTGGVSVNNGPPENTGQKKLAQKLGIDRKGLILYHHHYFDEWMKKNESLKTCHTLRAGNFYGK